MFNLDLCLCRSKALPCCLHSGNTLATARCFSRLEVLNDLGDLAGKLSDHDINLPVVAQCLADMEANEEAADQFARVRALFCCSWVR